MMKLNRQVFLSLAAASLVMTGGIARADSVGEGVEAVEAATGLELSGTAYGYYQYNFNQPDSRKNSIRSLDSRHNSFTFELFQLQVAKEGPGGISFTSKLDFGKTAAGIAADWDGDGSLSSSEETNDFEVQEAYLTYAPDWAGGMSMKAGKFVTLLGAEVIEATSNSNFTRSFLFGFAIPFTHTGLLFNAPIGDTLSVNAGVVNGWDNVVDNNDGKTFLGNVAFAPSDSFSLSVNGVFGPEKTDTGSDPRGVVDVVSAIAMGPTSLVLNFDYGNEGSAALDGGDATWVGFAGIVGLDLAEMSGLPLGVYLRGEVFDDSDGARTGTDQTLTEVTLTGKYFATENLTFWLEYRHDDSNKDGFEDEGSILLPDLTTTPRFTDTQDTALLAISYTF